MKDKSLYGPVAARTQPAEEVQVPNTFKLPGEDDEAWVDRITGAAPAQQGEPQAPVVPATHKLVPIEPTPEMFEAGWKHGTEGGGIQNLDEAWAAMLAVATKDAE